MEERIKNTHLISEKNKELIFKFKDLCFAEGLSDKRVLIYLIRLDQIARVIGTNFDTATREEVMAVMGNISQRGLAPNTVRMYKITFKKFFKTMFGDGEFYPEVVRKLRTTDKATENVLPENLLTKEDIDKMIDAAENPKDKAYLAVLYESGCRVGEITRMQIKHVTFDELGAQILVNGKTGHRRVRLIWSVHYLLYWLESHPMKTNPEWPLWISLTGARRGKQMIYATVRTMLLKLARKAGITKSVRPHATRHARATELAKMGLNQPQMEAMLGWKHGSDMPQTYLHLSGKDVDDALLQAYGIKKKEDQTIKKKCSRCFKMSDVSERFCTCGMPLDLRAAVEAENKTREFHKEIAKIMELLKDNDVKEFLAEKMASKGG